MDLGEIYVERGFVGRHSKSGVVERGSPIIDGLDKKYIHDINGTQFEFRYPDHAKLVW